jgi:hypothetical protein
VVEDPEVDPPVRRFSLGVLALVAGLVAAMALLLPAPSAAAGPVPSVSSPVQGNISGPGLVPTHSNTTYHINGTGGPAFENGTLVGTLTWHVKVEGVNLTGVSVTPSTGKLVGSLPGTTVLSTGTSTQTLTIVVELSSTLGSQNVSTNLTYPVVVVVPYEVRATLVAGPGATVLNFTVAVELDGSVVGTVPVPTLVANQTYNLTFRYATTVLSVGWHTFSISLAEEHGLVTFAGGVTEYSAAFYVAGPPPSLFVWYLAGTVAFFGVLFISATRAAARRRGGRGR